MIKAIVCVDSKWSIGKDNDLLFKLPEDMRRFRRYTTGKVVVHGYNTLLSFPRGRPLANRATICLCPSEVDRDDCYCVHDFNETIKLVKELAKTQDIYIIGGAMLYRSFLPFYDEVIVTKVDASGDGTVFFPNLDENPDFYLEYQSEDILDGEYITSICTYKRKLSA